MSGSDRSIAVRTTLDEATVSVLDGQATKAGLTRAELLGRLVAHYRDACENGLSCPHCKNEILIDL